MLTTAKRTKALSWKLRTRDDNNNNNNNDAKNEKGKQFSFDSFSMLLSLL